MLLWHPARQTYPPRSCLRTGVLISCSDTGIMPGSVNSLVLRCLSILSPVKFLPSRILGVSGATAPVIKIPLTNLF